MASGWCPDPGELPLRLSLRLDPLVTEPAGLFVPAPPAVADADAADAEAEPFEPGSAARPPVTLLAALPLVPLPAGMRGEKEDRWKR